MQRTETQSSSNRARISTDDVRPSHQPQLIAAQIAAIPASPYWKIGQLVEDIVLPFELQDPRTGRWYKMHLGLDNYNLEPPRLTVRHPDTGLATWNLAFWPPRMAEQAAHPITRRPFCCVLGLQDYHTHPRHQDHPWDAFRNVRGLDAIIADIAVLLGQNRPEVHNAPLPM
jgi:hypothetical protein